MTNHPTNLNKMEMAIFDDNLHVMCKPDVMDKAEQDFILFFRTYVDVPFLMDTHCNIFIMKKDQGLWFHNYNAQYQSLLQDFKSMTDYAFFLKHQQLFTLTRKASNKNLPKAPVTLNPMSSASSSSSHLSKTSKSSGSSITVQYKKDLSDVRKLLNDIRARRVEIESDTSRMIELQKALTYECSKGARRLRHHTTIQQNLGARIARAKELGQNKLSDGQAMSDLHTDDADDIDDQNLDSMDLSTTDYPPEDVFFFLEDTNTTRVFNVPLNTTVEKLKTMIIGSAPGFSIDNVKLTYCNNLMKNRETLEDHAYDSNITKNIICTFRTLAGSSTNTASPSTSHLDDGDDEWLSVRVLARLYRNAGLDSVADDLLSFIPAYIPSDHPGLPTEFKKLPRKEPKQ